MNPSTQFLPIKDIQQNEGQVPGLPRNPRLIKDRRFEMLKKSITDFPEMLELREAILTCSSVRLGRQRPRQRR